MSRSRKVDTDALQSIATAQRTGGIGRPRRALCESETVDDVVISVRGLRKRYGDLDAVAGIDLEVRRGEIFAFLGPNGAGKTTTVEILEGFRQRSDGDVRVLGE